MCVIVVEILGRVLRGALRDVGLGATDMPMHAGMKFYAMGHKIPVGCGFCFTIPHFRLCF